MTDASGDHEYTVSIGGRTITNLRFADDIDGLAGEEGPHGNSVERPDNRMIKVNGQKLETAKSFKYLGSVIIGEGSKPEILSRIAQTTAALTRLKPVWIDKSISLSSRYN